MVFTAGKRKGRWGTRHFGEGNSLKRCLDKHCMFYTTKMYKVVECYVC